MNHYDPIFKNTNFIMHGADYNPEQWIEYPEILAKDIEMMKQAGCNIMSIGIFSWSSLEPEEGVFNFTWLDNIIASLYKNDIRIFLATPGGAKPAWMSEKYPEILRVSSSRVRNLHGGRHNHCPSSPVYREKVSIINKMLAERYASHPALVGWHVSNEYGGECHCERCNQEFRRWLQKKYGTLEEVNRVWWTCFWSHQYNSWEQIESPSPLGEDKLHGLNLDWRRFVTDLVSDFCQHEIKPLKAANSAIPVTTNFMRYFPDYDYWKLSEPLDFISWDSYPLWHSKDNIYIAAYTAMFHDLMRTLKKGKPFVLMESTPAATNWQAVSKLKKPGMHILSSIQAIAHGADSVQYFQWRKSRGSSEKFHGAVVDHVGHLDTRVGKEVIEMGNLIKCLATVAGSRIHPEMAVIYDWENKWALEDALGPRNIGMDYDKTVVEHYKPFWEKGIAVDVINSEQDLSAYKLLVAPMLYMIRPGVAENITKFVENGGTVVVTYWSGIVNESDLCFLNGFPGPLRKLLGIWSEEIDSLEDDERNTLTGLGHKDFELSGNYSAKHLCERIHLEGASALANYTSDFYAGTPAVTVNHYGKGQAYYIASRNDEHFMRDFTSRLVQKLNLTMPLLQDLPSGVTAHTRQNASNIFTFIQNYNAEDISIDIPDGFTDMLTLAAISNPITLPAFGSRILSKVL